MYYLTCLSFLIKKKCFTLMLEKANLSLSNTLRSVASDSSSNTGERFLPFHKDWCFEFDVVRSVGQWHKVKLQVQGTPTCTVEPAMRDQPKGHR